MRNPPTFSNYDPHSAQISKLTQIHHICYTLTPTIDYISEPYSNSHTSSQHVSKWHRLRNHVSETAYEKIHTQIPYILLETTQDQRKSENTTQNRFTDFVYTQNPNIPRNTNPRSLGLKKRYRNSYIDIVMHGRNW